MLFFVLFFMYLLIASFFSRFIKLNKGYKGMMNRRADSKLSRLDNIGKLHNRTKFKKKIILLIYGIFLHLVRRD